MASSDVDSEFSLNSINLKISLKVKFAHKVFKFIIRRPLPIDLVAKWVKLLLLVLVYLAFVERAEHPLLLVFLTVDIINIVV